MRRLGPHSRNLAKLRRSPVWHSTKMKACSTKLGNLGLQHKSAASRQHSWRMKAHGQLVVEAGRTGLKQGNRQQCAIAGWLSLSSAGAV